MRNPPSSLNKAIGQNLKAYRKSRGVSMQALAESLNLTYQQLQKYEYGKSRLRVDTLVQISEFFDECSVEFLSLLINHKPCDTDKKHAGGISDDVLELAHIMNNIKDQDVKKSLTRLLRNVAEK